MGMSFGYCGAGFSCFSVVAVVRWMCALFYPPFFSFFFVMSLVRVLPYAFARLPWRSDTGLCCVCLCVWSLLVIV